MCVIFCSYPLINILWNTSLSHFICYELVGTSRWDIQHHMMSKHSSVTLPVSEQSEWTTRFRWTDSFLSPKESKSKVRHEIDRKKESKVDNTNSDTRTVIFYPMQLHCSGNALRIVFLGFESGQVSALAKCNQCNHLLIQALPVIISPIMF